MRRKGATRRREEDGGCIYRSSHRYAENFRTRGLRERLFVDHFGVPTHLRNVSDGRISYIRYFPPLVVRTYVDKDYNAIDSGGKSTNGQHSLLLLAIRRKAFKFCFIGRNQIRGSAEHYAAAGKLRLRTEQKALRKLLMATGRLVDRVGVTIVPYRRAMCSVGTVGKVSMGPRPEYVRKLTRASPARKITLS